MPEKSTKIRFIPARPGAAVALYLWTRDQRIAEEYRIELLEDEGDAPLEYVLKEVMGWGVYTDLNDDVVSAPLVMDAYGALVFAKKPHALPTDLAPFEEFELDANVVCTVAEAEARVNDIINKFGVDKARIGFSDQSGYGGGIPELPANFRL